MKLRFVFFLTFLLSISLSAQPSFVRDSIDNYINRVMKDWDVPGLAVAIVKDGKIVLEKGYGVRELGSTKKVNEHTLFMIASCSKAFTATALAELEQGKKLSLDDTVTKWLPYFRLYDPAASKMVTVRDLLCHRLGLVTFQGDFVHWDSNLSREEIIRQLAKYPPAYGFRTRYGYCNAAFLAAGEIIPKAAGLSWDDYLEKEIFSPLQMNRTGTHSAEMPADTNACKPHSFVDAKMSVIGYDNIDNLGPAASINSSVHDLSQWAIMQLDSGRYGGKQIVPFAALQQTRNMQVPLNRKSKVFPDMHFSGYALGWYTNDMAGRQIFYHDGGAGGFISNVTIVPEEKLGIVVLTNTDANQLNTVIRNQILEAYLGKPYRDFNKIYLPGHIADKKEISDNEASLEKKIEANAKNRDLSKYAGTYSNELYGKAQLSFSNGELTAKFEHHPQLNVIIVPVGDNMLLFDFANPVFGKREVPVAVDTKTKAPISFALTLNDFLDLGTYTFKKEK